MPKKSVFSKIVSEPHAGKLELRFARFLVKTSDGTCWIVETKGRVELDLPAKMARLARWCADATSASAAVGGPAWRFVFVDEEGVGKARPASFAALAAGFTDYQPPPRVDV